MQEVLEQRKGEMLRDLGGFGSYQVYIFIMIQLAHMSGSLILMSLIFLEKTPNEYLCIYSGSAEEVECQPLDFC